MERLFLGAVEDLILMGLLSSDVGAFFLVRLARDFDTFNKFGLMVMVLFILGTFLLCCIILYALYYIRGNLRFSVEGKVSEIVGFLCYIYSP
jgi:hypothetical protein